MLDSFEGRDATTTILQEGKARFLGPKGAILARYEMPIDIGVPLDVLGFFVEHL